MTIRIESIHPMYIETTSIDMKTPEFMHTQYKVYYTLYLDKHSPLQGETIIEHLLSLEAMEAIIEHKIKATKSNETNQSK
jgi:hypothetical protein